MNGSAKEGGATRSGSTREQDLLLRAALLRGPEGIDAWRAWSAATSIDALDGDSQWLLPLLYHNLHAQGVSPSRLLRYRNVYLHNWYKNNLTLRRAQPSISPARRACRPPVILGGAAMALRHYEALGARPFGPVQVLVRARSDSFQLPANVTDSAVEVRASLFGADIDDAVVQRASAGAWKTMRWLVLDPADQLVDICARRREWDRRSQLFWVADAATLIRRHPDLDWDRVAALAARLDRQASVASALRSVEERLRLGIPPIAPCGPGPAPDVPS